MPRFAVYYIPKADDDFYRLGTSIIGYSVRSGKHIQIAEEIKNHLKGFSQEWVNVAQLYGFHLTIGCPIDFNFGELLSIEHEIDDILKCFNPEHQFTLSQSKDDFIHVGTGIYLRYEPNQHFRILHTLVLALAQKYGTGSFYVERYYNNRDQYDGKPYMANRILKFYNYPYVLDDWSPHFTLLNRCDEESPQDIVRFLSERFNRFEHITVDTISLLIQMKDGENWRICKEFTRELPKVCS